LYQFIIAVVLFFLGIELSYSKEFQISGTISDSISGEIVFGVTVQEKSLKIGVFTDKKGSFRIMLPEGKRILSISSVGYVSKDIEVKVNINEVLNIKLSPTDLRTDEVNVFGEKKDHNIKSTEISTARINMAQVERIPIIMGETDIFKTIQMLPGITSIAEGRSGFVVRGSGIDQNLILMDGMPLYYSSHMQGLYSVFNSEAVDGLTVYKGGIPARFGGRGASVLDVRMRESDAEEFHAKIALGLISSKFSLEAPIIENKLSVFLAGRSTKLSIGTLHDIIKEDDLGSQSGGKSGGKGTSGDDFYFFDRNESWFDLNAKIIYNINDNNKLFLSAFYGQDSALVVGGLTEWGNRAASIRFQHKIDEKLLSNTSLIYSKYYTAQMGGVYQFQSWIGTVSFKQEFSYLKYKDHDIRIGLNFEYQDFNHGGLKDVTQDDAGKFMPPMQGLESALYIEDDMKITDYLSAYLGLRYSTYHRLGPGDSFIYDEESNEPVSSEYFSEYTDVMAFHHVFEPRVALTYLLSGDKSIKLSYNRNAQYMRLMSLGAEIQWYDIWMPSTSNIDPMVNDQLAIGYFQNFFNNDLKLSAEAYYKWIKNASDFEDGLHNYLVDNLEAYVAMGKGRSYGFEVSLEKPYGDFNGRISYNYGVSEYQIDVINQGRWYPFMFDKTHNIVMLASYEIIDKLILSTSFFYSTGRPITLPESYYYISGVPFPYWEGRNKYRLPDYHRLDFGVKYEPDFLAIGVDDSRDIRTGLELSFYNVYDRRNVHTIAYAVSGGKGGSDEERIFSPYGISTYGFMPTFQMFIKF
jgi:hypothetical protein